MVIIALLDSKNNNNGLNLLKVTKKNTAAGPCSWQCGFAPQLKAYTVAGYTTSAAEQQSLWKANKKISYALLSKANW